MKPNLNGGVAATSSHQYNITAIERVEVIVCFDTGHCRLRLRTQVPQGLEQIIGCGDWIMQHRCKLDVLKVVTVLGHELQHQGLLGALHALVVEREPLDHFVLPLVHEARQYPELPIHVGKVCCHMEFVRPDFSVIAWLVQPQMLEDSG